VEVHSFMHEIIIIKYRSTVAGRLGTGADKQLEATDVATEGGR